MDIIGTSQNLRPLSLLSDSNCCDSIHLQVFSNSVSWSIYLEQGKIIYASHSVAPFDRLDCHLRCLNHQTPISKIIEIRTQLHQMSLKLDAQSVNQLLPDYEAIIWLVRQEYLTSIQASTLIEGVTREVIESFLLLKKGTYKLGNKLKTTPILCRLEVQPIVEYCQKNLKLWQTLAPHICSPYQRPYFSSQNRIKSDLSLEIRQRLSAMLKGFSFYHLAVILNQDKLQLAQSLHPYIKDGAVLLHDPNPPFNQLPKTFVQLSKSPGSLENLSPTLRNNGSEGVTRNPDILDKPSSTQLSMAPTVEGFKGLSKMSEFVVGGAVDKLQTPMESATPTRTVMFGVPYSSPTKQGKRKKQ